MIDCQIFDTFIGSIVPGDKVFIGGILKLSAPDDGLQKNENSFTLYLKSLYTVNASDDYQNPLIVNLKITSLSNLICTQRSAFQSILSSFAPHLSGIHFIKSNITS